MSKIQEVEVAVRISGDYVAFHEMSTCILYDYTNKKLIDGDSLEGVEELVKEGHDRDYSDTQKQRALLIDGTYYLAV